MPNELINFEIRRGLIALMADLLILLILGVPGFIWVGSLQARVEKLEQERVEQREDIKEILRKVDDIRDRLQRPAHSLPSRNPIRPSTSQRKPMTPVEIGLIVLVVAAIVYYLHSEKGKAQLAALEANIKQHVTANASPAAPAAPQPAQPIEVHIHQPDAPAAPVAPPQALFPGYGVTAPIPVAPPSAPIPPAAPQPVYDEDNGLAPWGGPGSGQYWSHVFGNQAAFPRLATSKSFQLDAGTYSANGTDGLQLGYATMVLDGFGPVRNSTGFVCPAGTYTVTITASQMCRNTLQIVKLA